MKSTRTHICLLSALCLGMSLRPNLAQAPTDPKSNRAPGSCAVDSDSLSWLFPIAKLDESLPSWLHIGVEIVIQPKDWLKFFGEVQDSRIFFNHHIPNANPFEDSWTLWQSYAQVGSSTSGWGDTLAGRQVLALATNV